MRPALDDVVPRNLYVKRSDTEEFGTTPLCPGCEAGLPDQTERITMSADSVSKQGFWKQKGGKNKSGSPAKELRLEEGKEAPGGGEALTAIAEGTAHGEAACYIGRLRISSEDASSQEGVL